jgi:hypothetical protein
LPEHYFLPKTNIAFTAIPKTGCTSLKNYLIDLERAYSAGNFDLTQTEYLNMGIHSSKLASQYQITAAQFAAGKSSPNILVLRDPYQRALSAWTNKLLYAQDDYSIYHRLKMEPFTPVEFESMEDLNTAFESFAIRLFQDPVFLDSDTHWKPQHTFVRDLSKHQIVLETSNLSSLQTTLATDPRFGPYLVNKAVPRFNATRSQLMGRIGTNRAWDLIERTYAQDFHLLEQAGLSKPARPSAVQEDRQLEQSLISEERPFIEKSRSDSEEVWKTAERDSELLQLRSELEAIKSSHSWRWTAILRKIAGLVLR